MSLELYIITLFFNTSGICILYCLVQRPYYCHDDDVRNVIIWENRSADECACTAYVTFKDAYAVETAVLLSVSHQSTFCKETMIVNWMI